MPIFSLNTSPAMCCSADVCEFLATSRLERQNREIARRTDVVGIFPNPEALLRLTTAYLQEQDEEWLTERRYMSIGSLSEVSADIAVPVQAKFAA
jgi:transposase-like protein